MQNKELKKKLINEGIYQDYQKERFINFSNGCLVDYKDNYQDLNLTDIEFKSCGQLADAKRKQRRKIKDWIEYYISRENDYALLFGTLTFNDRALNLSFEARAKAVQRTLTKYPDYVSNIDFGAKNEREHYHCIVAIERECLDWYDWKKNKFGNLYVNDMEETETYTRNYGFVNFQLIDITKDCFKEKLAGYIAKLVNHSLKVKQTKLGYKRVSDYQTHKLRLKEVKHIAHSQPQFGIQRMNKIYYYEQHPNMAKWLEDASNKFDVD